MAEEKKETELMVVKEFPTVQTNTIEDDQGKVYKCITIEQSLKEILETVREIKKQIA